MTPATASKVGGVFLVHLGQISLFFAFLIFGAILNSVFLILNDLLKNLVSHVGVLRVVVNGV